MLERVINMDITNFISWFLTQTLNIFTWFFNLLDSIKFYNVSLLSFCITIVIISVLIPVILTITKGDKINSERSSSKKASKSEVSDEKSN